MASSRVAALLLLTIAVLACAITNDGSDSVVPDDAPKKPSLNNHAERGRLIQQSSRRIHKNMELLYTGAASGQEADLWKQMNVDAHHLLDEAEKMPADAKGKKETIDALKRFIVEAPRQKLAIDSEKKMAEEDQKQLEKEEQDRYGDIEKPASMLELAQRTAKGAAEDNHPDVQELREIHDGLKQLARDHNVDMTGHHTRSPEEHNNLIVDFLVQTHELVEGGAWHKDDPSKPKITDEDLSLLQQQLDLSTEEGKKRLRSSALKKYWDENKADHAANCMKGILVTVPPNFCWKSGKHNHEIPTKCAPGWFRHMAECFRGCEPGSYFVGGGTCWETCEHDYDDHGASCYYNLFDWYFKWHYWADRRTNFSPESRCNHDDQYKSGAMCYKKCSTYAEASNSLTNCAWDGCSATGGACAVTILNMIQEIGFTIANIMTMGGTQLVKVGAKMVAKMGSKGAVKAIVKNAVVALTRAGLGEFAKKSLKNGLKKINKVSIKSFSKSVIKDLGQNFVENAAGNLVKQFCNELARGYYSKMQEKEKEFDYKNLDPTGIAGAVDACGAVDDPDYGIKCAAGVVGALGTFDPTGLLGVAAAFMHPTCREPTPPGPPIPVPLLSERGSSGLMYMQAYPGRCGPDYYSQQCGKAMVIYHGFKLKISCDTQKYCSKWSWCGDSNEHKEGGQPYYDCVE